MTRVDIELYDMREYCKNNWGQCKNLRWYCKHQWGVFTLTPNIPNIPKYPNIPVTSRIDIQTPIHQIRVY
jgi:hypothetical protein